MSFFEPTASAIHFSAGITGDITVTGSTLTAVTFGNVIANTSVNSTAVFTGATGIFVAPVTGIYFFTFNAAFRQSLAADGTAIARFGFQYGGTTGAYTDNSLTRIGNQFLGWNNTNGDTKEFTTRHSITVKLSAGERCSVAFSTDTIDTSNVVLEFNFSTVKPIFSGYLVAEVP